MYLVSGNGHMPVKEIEAQLGDLINKAVNIDDLDCWFAIHVTDTCKDTRTQEDIVRYFNKIDAYYEVWTETNTTHELFDNAAAFVTIGENNAVEHMAEVCGHEEGESAILGLYANFDYTNDPEDALLNDQTIEALGVGIPVYALNHAMVRLESVVDNAEPAPEAKEVAPTKFDEDVERYNVLPSMDEWSREELSGLTIEELRAICLQAPKKASKDEIIDILMGISEFANNEEIPVKTDDADPIVEFLHALIEDANRMLENLQKGR
jgi:hypothetical protein